MQQTDFLLTNDIDNVCLLVASLAASNYLNNDLQNLLLDQCTKHFRELDDTHAVSKLFATVSRYASADQQTQHETQLFNSFKREMTRYVEDRV